MWSKVSYLRKQHDNTETNQAGIAKTLIESKQANHCINASRASLIINLQSITWPLPQKHLKKHFLNFDGCKVLCGTVGT